MKPIETYNEMNTETKFWLRQYRIMVVIFLITILLFVGYAYYNSYERNIKYESPKGCFYEFSLSYECHYQNGSIIPVVENNQSYYTCSKLNYKVPAC